jgi:hypothetical protein
MGLAHLPRWITEDLGVVFVEVGTRHGYLLFTHKNLQ